MKGEYMDKKEVNMLVVALVIVILCLIIGSHQTQVMEQQQRQIDAIHYQLQKIESHQNYIKSIIQY